MTKAQRLVARIRAYNREQAIIAHRMLSPPLIFGEPATIARDSFNRPNKATLDNAETGQAWTNLRTVASRIVSNRALRGAAAGTDYEGALVECNRADVEIEDEIIVVADVSDRMGGGVVFRYIDTNNFLFGTFNDGAPARFYLAKLEANVFTLFTQTAALYGDDTLWQVKVRAVSDQLEAFINGVSVLTFTLLPMRVSS